MAGCARWQACSPRRFARLPIRPFTGSRQRLRALPATPLPAFHPVPPRLFLPSTLPRPISYPSTDSIRHFFAAPPPPSTHQTLQRLLLLRPLTTRSRACPLRALVARSFARPFPSPLADRLSDPRWPTAHSFPPLPPLPIRLLSPSNVAADPCASVFRPLRRSLCLCVSPSLPLDPSPPPSLPPSCLDPPCLASMRGASSLQRSPCLLPPRPLLSSPHRRYVSDSLPIRSLPTRAPGGAPHKESPPPLLSLPILPSLPLLPPPPACVLPSIPSPFAR